MSEVRADAIHALHNTCNTSSGTTTVYREVNTEPGPTSTEFISYSFLLFHNRLTANGEIRVGIGGLFYSYGYASIELFGDAVFVSIA